MEIIDARFGARDHMCSGSWQYEGLNTTGHEIYACDSGKHTIIGPSLDASHECTDECERAQADIGQAEHYAPVMLCRHELGGSVSFHADQVEAHKAMYDSPEYPCRPELAEAVSEIDSELDLG